MVGKRRSSDQPSSATGRLAAIVAVGLALLLVACGGPDSNPQSDAKSDEASAKLQERVDRLEQEAREREEAAAKREAAAREREREARREARKAKKRAQARKAAPSPSAPAPDASGGGGGITVPNVVGLDHQAAQDALQGEGLWSLDERDCTGRGRALLFDRNWEVVSTDPPAGTAVSEDETITLCSVKQGEQ